MPDPAAIPTVFLIDDNADTCAMMAAWLKACPRVRFLGHAQSIEAARPFLLAHPRPDPLHPQILLLDRGLPGEDAMSYVKELFAESHAPCVIMLSGDTGKLSVQNAMAAGAMGYMGKDAPDEELVRAILTVHEGSLVLSDSARRSLNSRAEPGDTADTAHAS